MAQGAIPSAYPAQFTDLDVIVVINLYRALHGGDFFDYTPATEYLGKALVTTLYSQIKGASCDQLIENLGNLGFEVSIEQDGKKTSIRSTKQFREMWTAPGGARQIPPRKICVMQKKDGTEQCIPGTVVTLPW
jgi:hypothetical protein